MNFVSIRRPSAALALLAAALLPACSVLPKAEPVDLYLLPATAAPAAGAPALELALRVSRPEAARHLAGQRIVVLPDGDRVSVYKGASWSAPAPVLLRNRLLDAFRADGRIAALSSDDRALHADLELVSDLRAFHSEYRDGTPEAVILLDVRLVAPDTQRILASRRFEVHQPASGTGVAEVVRAFGTAGDALSAQLVAWTLEQATLQGR
ncbi:ABC-type transport auxiliary lipoprotein family protein [Pseudothauera rhizosphaerae]|uniref:ABC transporter n=1 Tax=Pseudothauera rhizosphaerae TaxID=2565932 RepID=A0A4S4APY7_9RHOO|nr:ABC-type transport auxiliary lipoprotein family protein [Pseudothauera rhizosphaerae]THF61711.1 ABC transporter [Pseudothauera rhizosphaerae]